MNFPALRFKDEDRQSFPEWKETSLGEIAKIIGGGTPDTSVAEYWGGNVQWFTPTEIKSKYASNSLRTITESGLKDSSAKLLPVGTLLFSSRATVGDVSIALNECTTNQGFQSMVVGDKNNKEFIYYWILNNKKTFLEKASGSTFLEISKKEIEKLPVQLPSIKEQTKIANFLTAVDKKITQLTQKHDLLTQYKKGVMKQIFSQKLRFKDDDGKNFPEWKKKLISEALNNYGGTALEEYVCSDGTHNFISIGNYEKNGNYFDNGQRIVLNEKTKQKLLKKDDLVMVLNDKTQAGDLIGATLLIKDDNKFIYNQRSERLVCNRGVVEPKFIWHLFNSVKFRKEIFSISQGGTQIYVNFPAVKKINISVPNIKEQTKIANFLTALDDKITATQTQLQAVKQYKQGLLQQMFV